MLDAHPDVRESRVSGLPHGRWGVGGLGTSCATNSATATAAAEIDHRLAAPAQEDVAVLVLAREIAGGEPAVIRELSGISQTSSLRKNRFTTLPQNRGWG